MDKEVVGVDKGFAHFPWSDFFVHAIIIWGLIHGASSRLDDVLELVVDTIDDLV